MFNHVDRDECGASNADSDGLPVKGIAGAALVPVKVGIVA
jgi:hypothetical protein